MPSYRKVQVHTLSPDFRTATSIVVIPELPKAADGHIVVKNHYLGIMATDTNLPNGFYGHTTPPFDCGIEAEIACKDLEDIALTRFVTAPACCCGCRFYASQVGVVTDVGSGVETLKVGDAVVYQKFGAFGEYVEVEASAAIQIPKADPSVLPLFGCGVSASIALEQAGEMKQGGQTVLVTAAAGTTGQFAVQLAKIAGNHVIGTTSSDEKAEALKKLGVDRVINYTKEDVSAVLKAEYPQGVDLVFDSVGGALFQAAVDNIAVRGRIIVFGLVSQYQGKSTDTTLAGSLTHSLLMKSASVRGFAVMFFLDLAPVHIGRLIALTEQGKLVSQLDPTEFRGLEAIPHAIDYMYNKKNVGKLVVKLV
ncbi:alcohol dehydrogenase, partial [Globisporangium splendens]